MKHILMRVVTVGLSLLLLAVAGCVQARTGHVAGTAAMANNAPDEQCSGSYR